MIFKLKVYTGVKAISGNLFTCLSQAKKHQQLHTRMVIGVNKITSYSVHQNFDFFSHKLLDPFGLFKDLEKNEGLLAVQESHFHGTEGWRKKKKRIYAKLRAVGRMNWALSMARTLVSFFDVDVVLTHKLELH
ncbi:hypothetical protein WUBG_02543 [Wuchereria bancrofti]|uniref:Uncharacterized protein n=1 Tax=Wuchereria bancrofti TaxID=6293 RepID=J9FAJ1_WUCBA|nr:hypothetical protein WUBG_02543 [Wuchereria bancrofti]